MSSTATNPNNNLVQFISSPTVHVLALAALAVYAFFSSLTHTNMAPLLAGTFAVLVMVIIHKRVDANLPSWRFCSLWRGASGRISTGTIAGSMLLASFVFIPYPFYAYQVIERGDGRTEYHRDMFVQWFNPFSDSATNYARQQLQALSPGHSSHGKWCTASSADGTRVVASFNTALVLPFDALPIAHRAAGFDANLQRLWHKELCRGLGKVLEEYSIAAMPSSLELAAGTIKDRSGMSALGIQYDGIVAVENLHVYAK